MGAILAKLRGKKSTLEVLEEIDKDIDSLIKLKHRNTQLEKHYAGQLIMWSVLLYVAAVLFCYFYFTPTSYLERVMQILPFLLSPVLIWAIRKLLRWYFVKRKDKNQLALEELRDKKKKILEEVKEKESYKKAKEILDKFDPPPPQPKPTPATTTPVPRLRQRPMTARGARTPNMPRSPPRQPGLAPMLTPQQQLMLRPQMPPSTARPILPRERGTFDKLVDLVVGDGPSSRYALICKHCYSHNGMAMQEEFEYLAFKCAYCHTFNPSKKVRPNAPQLPTPTATPLATPMAPRTSANAARDSAGSAGSRSGSEDNQSDTETGGVQPASDKEATTSDGENTQQGASATIQEQEESGEPSTSSANTEDIAKAEPIPELPEEVEQEITETAEETEDVEEERPADVEENASNDAIQNNTDNLQR
ncbi:endoplasmic reticulum junction formation protein lunapark-B-like [Amphiura filiformis]|uniref:endoplasmic reticulum junction formation protein lunapark-B-like n=1 Tax=Amphiura filiformis TaxID=82378 RepID=UPI003B212972